jgi:EAL domain-containing protein (putative c-di-GMP-specific phosphodiesterase class I)
MLLPEKKEREYRFRLALRIGLPIFALVVALVSHTLIRNYATLESSFYVEAVLLLAFSIYFIFYLIYSGFSVKITDDISKTFTREYLYKYLNKEINENSSYTLILISINNLSDINIQYGIKNGDKVLKNVVQWVNQYLKNQDIENYPFGHIKGGDFIIGLKGKKDRYETILELLYLKSSELKIDNIEVKISGAITDTDYSQNLDYMIENLFEIQDKTKHQKEDILNPSEVESLVINAINNRDLIVMTQDVIKDDKSVFKECFVKLNTPSNKPLFPKRYMKVINKLGLGVEYDRVVLEYIIKNLPAKHKYAINISPTSLRNDTFLSKCKELLNDNSTKIMFVISENEYYSYTNRFNNIINSLRKNGVEIVIDRVGSIHSSFLYLRELDIDIIRFDTYYSNNTKISQNISIIKGFNHMAHDLGIKTWIKNIEDEETLTYIKNNIDIDFIQGKYLSKMESIK